MDSGLTLELQVVYGRLSVKHTFHKGEITNDKKSNYKGGYYRIRTTHPITIDGKEQWLWLTKDEIERLAEQAAAKMARQSTQWWE